MQIRMKWVGHVKIMDAGLPTTKDGIYVHPQEKNISGNDQIECILTPVESTNLV